MLLLRCSILGREERGMKRAKEQHTEQTAEQRESFKNQKGQALCDGTGSAKAARDVSLSRYIGQVPCHHNHCAVTHEAASHQERNIINKVTLVRRFSLEFTLFSCPAPLILSSDTNSGITFHCSACGKVLLYCTGIGGRDY